MTEYERYEYEVLDELLEDVYKLYGKIEERREELRQTVGEEIPEGTERVIRGTEYELSDAETAIRGRLNELDEDYCVETSRHGTHSRWYNRRLAELAKAAGINYVALERVNYHDIEAAIEYIVDNGLASMSYEATVQAVKKFECKRHAERWEKYHNASDIDTFALDLKVPYTDLDAVIEYLRANGLSGCGMPATCEAIERYYAERLTA